MNDEVLKSYGPIIAGVLLTLLVSLAYFLSDMRSKTHEFDINIARMDKSLDNVANAVFSIKGDSITKQDYQIDKLQLEKEYDLKLKVMEIRIDNLEDE